MFRRSFFVWIVLMFAESIHGFLRIIWLAPAVGDFTARQISVFNGSLLIFMITYLLIPSIRVQTTRQCIFVGSGWVLLTLLFEIGLGRLVFQASWERIFSDYNLLQGGLMPLGLLCMLFTPLFAAKLKGIVK
ncbi:MAG: hypothetical protein U0T77_03745 [Chitinophagales bacterium]